MVDKELLGAQLDRLESRLDSVSTKLDTYQYSNLQLIHQIDKKVDGHEKVFSIVKWTLPPGAMLALFSVFKDWLPK